MVERIVQMPGEQLSQEQLGKIMKGDAVVEQPLAPPADIVALGFRDPLPTTPKKKVKPKKSKDQSRGRSLQPKDTTNSPVGRYNLRSRNRSQSVTAQAGSHEETHEEDQQFDQLSRGGSERSQKLFYPTKVTRESQESSIERYSVTDSERGSSQGIVGSDYDNEEEDDPFIRRSRRSEGKRRLISEQPEDQEKQDPDRTVIGPPTVRKIPIRTMSPEILAELLQQREEAKRLLDEAMKVEVEQKKQAELRKLEALKESTDYLLEQVEIRQKRAAAYARKSYQTNKGRHSPERGRISGDNRKNIPRPISDSNTE